jgi:hypothetical protein
MSEHGFQRGLVGFALGLPLIVGLSGCGESANHWTHVSLAAVADFGAAQTATAPGKATVQNSSGLTTSPHGIEADWEVESSLEPLAYRQQVTMQFGSQGFTPADTVAGQLQFTKQYQGDIVVVTVRPKSERRYAVHFSVHPY